MMDRRRAAVVILCAGLLPAVAAGQSTADQAQLHFTVGVGMTSSSGQLWRIGAQPFIVDSLTTDTLAISRGFRRTISVAFSGTYFPNNHLGLVAEAHLIGLGTRDRCQIGFTQGDTITTDLCRSIGNAQRNATSVGVSLGAVYRFASRQPVHPYLRVGGGLVVTQQSFVRTRGTVFTSGAPSDLVLFDDDRSTTVKPYALFGGGIVAVTGRGTQVRFEVRDNWIRVPVITGPTVRQGLIPPTGMISRHVLSFMIGVDIVLERKRGRRY
jgi:hypothetical protein